MSARRQSIVIKITSRFFGMLGAAAFADATVAAFVLGDALAPAIADPLVFAVFCDADEFCESSAAGARAQLAVLRSAARVHR
jgi:hypothetical protein